MTIPTPVSQLTPSSSEDKNQNEPLPNGVLAYFRARLSNRIHEIVLTEFAVREREGCLTRAELARRIRRKPEQITRWMGSPGNWTLDTVSDLLLGMGLEPALSVQSITGTQTPSFIPWSPDTVVLPLDVQTSEEVVQDMIEGNHKSMYFSLKKTTLSNVVIDQKTVSPAITHESTSYIPFFHDEEQAHASQK